MTKFAQWLEAKHGRGSELARYLRANSDLKVHRNQVTRVKLGQAKMPSRWVKLIVAFSGGELGYEDLL